MAQKPIHNLQTNEEIIEELTRDLNTTRLKTDEIESESEAQLQENRDKSDPWENIGKEEPDEGNGNGEANETPKNDIDEDLSDEESLKDRDLNLTDGEKEILKSESESVKNEANQLFKNGDFENALSMYSQGLKICPLIFRKERAILHANRAAAKSKLSSEKESAIKDCTKAIELDPNYVKAYLRRANLYEETEKFDEALEDFKKVLTFDPGHVESNCALRRLQPLIEERNEKLKAEMLGKLKDLGNLVLKPFGLSTNNFELQQDPNSGGYSVKFNQGPK